MNFSKGVATYCRDSVTPIRAEEGLTQTYCSASDNIGFYEHLHEAYTDDDLKDIDSEGRCIITQHTVKTLNGESSRELVVINVYCPHAENDERLEFKLKFYKALELRCKNILENGLDVIVLGDINTSHRLIDHCEPDDVEKFSKTPSRQWLDGFLTEKAEENKFIDTFRHLYPTREKSFTCWNTKLNARVNNYGTRIDYIFINSHLLPKLKDCAILSDVYGSDHCPVRTILDIDILPATRAPSVCTRFYKEFAGKQQKLLKFISKRSRSEMIECSSTGSVESESKKPRITKTVPQQSNLLMFFGKPKVAVPTPTHAATEIPVVADSAPESASDMTSEPKQSAPSASAQLWKSVLKGPPPPPVCKGHLEPCVLRTVKKKGPNMNRQFWACARATGHSRDPQAQCDYFLWVSSSKR